MKPEMNNEDSKKLAEQISKLINDQLPDDLPSAQQMVNVLAALKMCYMSYEYTWGDYGYKFKAFNVTDNQ